MALKQDGVHFTPCPKHDHKIEGVYVIWDFFLNGVRVSKPLLASATHLYPNTDRVPLPPGFSRSPHQEHNIPALKLYNSVIDLKNRLEL